jgi:hypothetical protein
VAAIYEVKATFQVVWALHNPVHLCPYTYRSGRGLRLTLRHRVARKLSGVSWLIEGGHPMKRFAVLAAALVFAVACDDSPASPSDPNIAKFTAILLPTNEVPAITNADASASGVAEITIRLTRNSAGALTGAKGDFTMHVTGFPANTVLTGAHIHNAPAGVNAGVIFNTGMTSGEFTLPTGQMTITKTDRDPVSAAVVQAILDNPAGHYFNIHTTINTGGAIRGQLVRMN